MKRCSVVLIALALLTTTIGLAQQPSAPSAPLTPFEQTLISAEKSFHEAAKKGEALFFKRTLTDDFSYVSYDGQLYGRQEMIDEYGSGGNDILPYEMKVVTISDNSALVTYNVVLRVPAAEDQGPPPRYQHFSTLWVKQGDAWKIKFLQMTANHWGDW